MPLAAIVRVKQWPRQIVDNFSTVTNKIVLIFSKIIDVLLYSNMQTGHAG